MTLDPLCEGAKVLTHSGPTLHWWLGLNAAEQGAWVSGLGAFAATLAAIGIATYQAQSTRQSRIRQQMHRAKLLAIDAAQYAIPLKVQINRARDVVKGARGWFETGQLREFRERLELPSAKFFPRGLALDDLPAELGTVIAELGFLTGAYVHQIENLPAYTPTVEDLESFESLDLVPMLDQAQRGLAAVAQHLTKYVEALEAIDFTVRNDGTHI